MSWKKKYWIFAKNKSKFSTVHYQNCKYNCNRYFVGSQCRFAPQRISDNPSCSSSYRHTINHLHNRQGRPTGPSFVIVRYNYNLHDCARNLLLPEGDRPSLRRWSTVAATNLPLDLHIFILDWPGSDFLGHHERSVFLRREGFYDRIHGSRQRVDILCHHQHFWHAG